MAHHRPYIASRQNSIVKRFRDAARRGSDVMLLDGAHLVAEAATAQVVLRHVIVERAAATRPDVEALVNILEARGIEVAEAAASVVDAASPVRTPTGIVAVADRPRHSTARLYDSSSPLVLIACDIQDPGNLGAIVRVAEAAGASGVVAAGASADPFGWKSLRGSMGSALRLPIAVVKQSDDAVADARRRGCRIISTVPREGTPLDSAILTGSIAILIGSEGSGLPSAIVEAADDRVTIPMARPVESLNAAVTSALLLYEAMRQRRGLRGFAVPGHS
ncbi:MAG TPA: RNA methyltransferase [Vicinamibacterales bacterium]|nr:RNA methyltransferase [Vicinamibacterales bacterium]